ncbi:hypothetical protein CIK05_04535 [Bdellovibrio sp. qaytius]|nr:hypothetical protein CIK05_04535 [Bdellovibrio sp. qaytius]
MRFFLVSAFLLLSGVNALAYPDFIGYGYRSCLVCHESGSGGGALTDYGRGVFASEIAMNPIRRWIGDEEAAQVSNFLGPVEFPFWLRMGFKYRALTAERSPGSAQSRKYYYNMQNDLNLNFFANEAHTLGLITTVGYVENPVALYPNKTIKDDSHLFYREYFIKANVAKEFWLYAGLMDKVFGLKTVNHTAYNRAALSLGQNDQVHAGLVQWARKEEDLFFQYWLGNLHLPKADRRSGASFMLDKKWGSMHAAGFSLLTESKTGIKQNIFSVHNKMGFRDGNSLLTEVGYRTENSKQTTESIDTNYSYIFTQNNLNLTRGLFLLSGLEYKNVSTKSSDPQTAPTNEKKLRWDLGFLMFPIQRMEFRVSGINEKTIGADDATKDAWSIQSQIHLSL